MTQRFIVSGGIGNQMFQYALYVAMRNMGKDVRLDVSRCNHLRIHNGYELEKAFGIDAKPIDNQSCAYQALMRVLQEFKPKWLTYHDSCAQSCEVMLTHKLFILGHFQSERFFLNDKDVILKAFRFRNISSENLSLADKMKETESVSLHIRRGDYVDDGRYENICTFGYYKRAVKTISEQVGDAHFYVFSDDTEWSASLAESLGIDFTSVDWNRGENSYQDMFLMSCCRHNILANSSFSWWGAYLNQYSDAIKIAPEGWDNCDSLQYNSMRVPETYIRLSSESVL